VRLRALACLPQRLAQCHRRRHRDIQRAQAWLDRDHQPRIGGGNDLVGDPCGLAPEQQDVGRAVAMIKIGVGTLGCEQDQPVTRPSLRHCSNFGHESWRVMVT